MPNVMKLEKNKETLKGLLIDECDRHLLAGRTWHKANKGYLLRRRRLGEKEHFLHRLIMMPPDGFYVDHINGNVLDNRRSNLRIASRIENCQNQKKKTNNTSGYKGVSFSKIAKKWHAYISVNKKRIHLGYFNCQTAAAIAYDKAAKSSFGEFAKPNFGGAH